MASQISTTGPRENPFLKIHFVILSLALVSIPSILLMSLSLVIENFKHRYTASRAPQRSGHAAQKSGGKGGGGGGGGKGGKRNKGRSNKKKRSTV